MRLKRGDVVTVAARGDFGKPCPAVIVQSDVFPEQHRSVVVCQMTTRLEDAADFRLTVQPSPANGLSEVSQIMIDKPVTVRRENVGSRLGHLDKQEVKRLNQSLAFVLGLAD